MCLLEWRCPQQPVSNMPDIWNVKYEGRLLQSMSHKIGPLANKSTGVQAQVASTRTMSRLFGHKCVLQPYLQLAGFDG